MCQPAPLPVAQLRLALREQLGGVFERIIVNLCRRQTDPRHVGFVLFGLLGVLGYFSLFVGLNALFFSDSVLLHGLGALVFGNALLLHRFGALFFGDAFLFHRFGALVFGDALLFYSLLPRDDRFLALHVGDVQAERNRGDNRADEGGNRDLGQ